MKHLVTMYQHTKESYAVLSASTNFHSEYAFSFNLKSVKQIASSSSYIFQHACVVMLRIPTYLGIVSSNLNHYIS
jgi:hypothetical protein